jgi:hypothetical protein
MFKPICSAVLGLGLICGVAPTASASGFAAPAEFALSGAETPVYDTPAPTGAKIASNLAKSSKGLYNCCFGYPIRAPSAGQQWLAVFFKPATNTTVKTIQLPLSIQGGTNAVVVTLNANAGGIPGTTLATFNVSSLPAFGTTGTCCALKTSTSTSGVAVTGGQTYWIVVKTGTGSTFQGVWHANVINQTATQSAAIVNTTTGGNWATTSLKPGLASGVFGP